jgi:3-methyladenine DNA glycosylase AlkD
MKLEINTQLPIRDQYQGLIQIIALANSWTPADGSANTFVENYLQARYKEVLRSLIESSLRTYYGLSQDALIKQAMEDFEQSFTCVANFNTEG